VIGAARHRRRRCWGPIAGDQQPQPGRTAIVTMGFDSSIDPAGVALAIDVDGDVASVPVAVS
jgi:hypothetical protein